MTALCLVPRIIESPQDVSGLKVKFDPSVSDLRTYSLISSEDTNVIVEVEAHLSLLDQSGGPDILFGSIGTDFECEYR